jgi:uncharacterized protein YbcC (UPF0753/DUF2309 family)
MNSTSNAGERQASSHEGAPALADLRRSIEHAAHYLPAQGPIQVFIHHNTLHVFDHLPFSEAVVRGERIFGCEPYLSEERFARERARGRIRDEDVVAVLEADLGSQASENVLLESRRNFRLALLRHAVYDAPAAELRWHMAESHSLRRFRPDVFDDRRDRFVAETRHWALRDVLPEPSQEAEAADETGARAAIREILRKASPTELENRSDSGWEAFGLEALWRACGVGVRCAALAEPPPAPVRHRDWLLAAGEVDADRLVHELLIPFCGSFLDQGLAPWALPGRERGFYHAFFDLHAGGAAGAAWRTSLPAEIHRLREANLSPLESIAESLELLGVSDSERDYFLAATLLALRGFAGMLWQVETRGDRVHHPLPADCLVEFLAVRLVLDRLALQFLARDRMGLELPLDRLRAELETLVRRPDDGRVRLAFQIFTSAQALGWLPGDLAALSAAEWRRIISEFKSFPAIERRRLLHLAYERRHRITTLDAIAAHRPIPRRPERPRFQAACCIDEREESFRRHLEEIAPDAATYGVAGFFGIAIYYRGLADAAFSPLCPAVMQPTHWVTEEVDPLIEASHRRRVGLRRVLGDLAHRVHLSSRTFSLGALLSGAVGALASIPLVARVLFPRATSRLRRSAGSWFQAENSRLHLERTAPTPGDAPDAIGYTVEEMTNVAEKLLRDIGAVSEFARLFFIIGHGSVSMNNPHESAHDCGACGGGRGGPNARAGAQMLNDPRVRLGLAARKLAIPEDVVFVGAMHNTCDDAITFFDLSAVPASHSAELAAARRDLEAACQRNAHERARRFESAPLALDPPAARRHVEGRSQDLAEVRPEYGHATNAVCVVGRRDRTRGLFMDRRTFLTSYDPTLDEPETPILARILGAVIPVCGGISLEYYFSYVDSAGWGCGTKLPHNITALLGVMDGAASDLRTGLPWQMVEVHEPVRLIFVVETAPENLLRIIERNATIAAFCRNQWVQLVALDPGGPAMQVFDGLGFIPYVPEQTTLPAAPSSIEWYRGWRDHLGYAAIRPRPDARPAPGGRP